MSKTEFKKWIVGNPDREKAKELANEFDIDPFSALIACSRGVNDASELELLLTEEPLLCDSKELVDVKAAAECINNSVSCGEKIAVFGDYDCDGVVATYIMYDCLSKKGADVIAYIPDRVSEGYGMNITAIDKLHSFGVKLIITVDNGIAGNNEIDYANKLGIKTVVTDHHLPPETLPDAVAVVDPHRIDCPSQFKEICGAQVAFKTVCVVEDVEAEEILYRYADLLAVALIGDVMPLVNENRSIVKEGIKKIKTKPNTGIGAILSVAGIDRKTITSGRISFGIVPRINAAGRMGDAKRALDMLLCDNMLDALKYANEIDEDNTRRQQTEKDIFINACEIIEKNNYDRQRVIVVSGENWHCGVLGIAASRICEKYSKPTIILTNDGEIYHGSGRSFSGFNLFDAISYCSDILERFGGHELAAGVSVKRENIENFRSRINEYAQNLEMPVQSIKIDFRINPAGLSVDMADAIKVLEPFGMGNPTPVFGIFEATLEKITALGDGKHLKLLFSKSGNVFQCMLFNVTPEQFCFEYGDVLDLAVTLDASFFRDVYSLKVIVKAVRISGIDQDRLFSDISKTEDFIVNKKVSPDIVPTREEIGVVFKEISRKPLKVAKAKHQFLNGMGYAKSNNAIMILKELGLIVDNDGFYITVPAKKTDLIYSDTYRMLNGGNICEL